MKHIKWFMRCWLFCAFYANGASIPEHTIGFFVMRGQVLARLEEPKYLTGSRVRWVENLDMVWATKKKEGWETDEEKGIWQPKTFIGLLVP